MASKVAGRDPALMSRLAPPFASIRDEPYSGCWRTTYSGERLESWSYYERGQGAAMRGCLLQAWAKHQLKCGEACPWLEEINSIPD